MDGASQVGAHGLHGGRHGLSATDDPIRMVGEANA